MKDFWPYDGDDKKPPSCLEAAMTVILGVILVCMALTKIFLGF